MTRDKLIFDTEGLIPCSPSTGPPIPSMGRPPVLAPPPGEFGFGPSPCTAIGSGPTTAGSAGGDQGGGDA